jgi:hypothetical protein
MIVPSIPNACSEGPDAAAPQRLIETFSVAGPDAVIQFAGPAPEDCHT